MEFGSAICCSQEDTVVLEKTCVNGHKRPWCLTFYEILRMHVIVFHLNKKLLITKVKKSPKNLVFFILINYYEMYSAA